MTSADQVLNVLERQGSDQYGSEAVSQLQHALQCAHLAECSGAPDELVVAALLHDIGHLIHELGENAAARGVDDRHEILGRKFLAAWFDEDVTGPVELHVEAKRYLCAMDPGYHGSLSRASVRSLELQGGPFTETEAAKFAARPHAHGALSVRCWDEQAKDPGVTTPDLGHFRAYVGSVIRT